MNFNPPQAAGHPGKVRLYDIFTGTTAILHIFDAIPLYMRDNTGKAETSLSGWVSVSLGFAQ
jgi:hypothetical protein